MLKKVKNWLGIEGVKIKLDVPETFKLKDQELTGSYTISSLSEQYIESIRLVLVEKYVRGRRKSKLIDEYILGEKVVDVNKSIDNQELIVEMFSLKFHPIKSAMDRFGDKNFLFKGIMGAAKLLKNAKSQYYLIVEATVSGNKLKPYDKVDIVAS